MSTSQVTGAWQRIEQWLAASAPGQLASLRPGAGAAAVADAQQRLGLRFPDDLVASLSRHDGASPPRGHFTVYGPFRPVALAGSACGAAATACTGPGGPRSAPC
jgi:cell wall assembly regulator SMI1